MLQRDTISRLRTAHWMAVSIAILAVDYATGPFIQFPILFLVPVAMATATHGRKAGAAVGVLLPLLRLSFFLRWDLPSSWLLEGIDTAIDSTILIGFAVLIERTLVQQRQIRVLEGLLPICSFCKKIRDERGEWRHLERFISERSRAEFSHTFCPECGRANYGHLAD